MNVQAIEFNAPDGVTLRGQRWAGGDTWLILFHDAGSDLDCWQPLLRPLLAHGYSLCALDMRGHGASDGDWNAAALDGDLEAAIAYAQQHGALKIGFIGAGEAALPALEDARARRLFAIVALSPGPLKTMTANDLRGAGVPKLFILGSHDAQAAQVVQQLRDRAIGWTVIVRLPTADQGRLLLAGSWLLHAQEQTLAFLEEQRLGTHTRKTR